ncbi:MAG: purple acid phosphatase family protein [Coraliomargarita sp.]
MNKQLFLLLGCATALAANPEHVTFTYMGSPSTSLTANWQHINSANLDSINEAIVYYDTKPRGGKLDQYQFSTSGEIHSIDGLNDRVVGRVNMEGLKPATTYYIVVGSETGGISEELAVRTIPSDDRPLRFVSGGDMGISEEAHQLLKHAASYDPDFVIIGGDIAYANGDLNSVRNWDIWFNRYTESMRTSDGRTVPLVLAIGNHEVPNDGSGRKDAPFYFGFFGQDDANSYYKREFGANLGMIVLDTGHTTPHEAQVDWIDASLDQLSDKTHTLAVYHVPFFPSAREYMSPNSVKGRELWAPIFDKHNLSFAIENHDHSFKRSHPMKGAEPATDGIGTVHIGDGCWGTSARPIEYNGRPYLAKSGSIQHFWVVDVSSESIQWRALDIQNRVFDVYPANGSEAEQADAVFASIEQTYLLPRGFAKLEPIQVASKLWTGGNTSLHLKNVMDGPVSIRFKARTPDQRFAMIGLPKDNIKLSPGESAELPLEIKAMEEILQPLKKLSAAVVLDVELQGTEGSANANFKSIIRLPFKRQR